MGELRKLRSEGKDGEGVTRGCQHICSTERERLGRAGKLPPTGPALRARRRLRGVLRTSGAACRPQALQQGETRGLRVWHRAESAAGGRRRAGAGGVLPDGDAVHPVRHRDGVPLPLRRRRERARAVRAGGGLLVHPYPRLRLRLRVAARRARLELTGEAKTTWDSRNGFPTGSCWPAWRSWSTGAVRTRCGRPRSAWPVARSR